jgi:hypothetical protein
MTEKRILSYNFYMGIKNVEFDAEFESLEKVEKKLESLELLQTVLKVERVHNSLHFRANNFLIGIPLGTFIQLAQRI